LGTWSCGNAKGLRANDRFFMLKQGRPPRGIVASGWITSTPYAEEHWDLTKKKKGIKAHFVKLRFEALLVPEKEPILGVGELNRGPLATVHWRTQMSGIRIPDEAAVVLERVWESHLETLRGAAAGPDATPARPDIVAEPRRSVPSTDELLMRISAGARVLGASGAGRDHLLYVDDVLGLLTEGQTTAEILAKNDWLEPDDVRACLAYARRLVAAERGRDRQ
jgi:uncharacterized protein (DUF433 family)